jgi:hypothetical protein
MKRGDEKKSNKKIIYGISRSFPLGCGIKELKNRHAESKELSVAYSLPNPHSFSPTFLYLPFHGTPLG